MAKAATKEKSDKTEKVAKTEKAETAVKTVKRDVSKAGEEVGKERAAQINKILSASVKLFGEGTIKIGSDSSAMEIESVSTGSLSLNNAIGVGGLPKGRIIEVSGLEASGKTLISLSTIAEVQKAGGVAAFIDVEHALTPVWCKSLGVDYNNLIITRPDSGEKALSIMKFLVEQGGVDIVVLDSVAALVTKREIEGDMDANHMALTARLMSLALKKLTPIVSKSSTCCIFINQIRENVGQMFGNKETTPGGKALKFYSSVRLKVWKTSQGAIKSGSGENIEQIGHNVSIRVEKNKVGPPFRTASFDIYYTAGIDWKSELFKLALEKNVIQRPTPQKYTFIDYEWKGKDSVKEAIQEDEKLALELKERVVYALANGAEEEATVEVVDGKIIDKETGDVVDEVVTEEDILKEFEV